MTRPKPPASKATSGLNAAGFLYLSEAVLAKVKEATGDSGKGTVDELKFGPLYETMSEILFPWCSTLTSRARYFYFGYAVLKLALDATISTKMVSPSYQRQEVSSLARGKLLEFRRNTRRIEKYLSLALNLMGNQDGAAGRNKVTRWCSQGRDAVKAPCHSMILSLDGRYPNAIYRAPCKSLNLFVKESHNQALLQSRLLGIDPFQPDWVSAGQNSLWELESIVEFWEARANDSLIDVATAFRASPAFKRFNGFNLRSGEAIFLYDKIQEKTTYWKSVTPTALMTMFGGDVDFILLKEYVDGKEKDYFDIAGHIDVATRHFRHYYAEIVASSDVNPSTGDIAAALPEILASISWLDSKAQVSRPKVGWEDIWVTGYSRLLRSWATSIPLGPKKLAKDLKLRAESVVAMRGRGKEAPHLRQKPDDGDIDKELELQPSSFRLSNATRILRDISVGMRDD